MSQWDPAKHPRGPIGRFISVADVGAWNPNPRLVQAQRGLVQGPGREGGLGEVATTVENAYRRGSMFSGTPMTQLPRGLREAAKEYVYDSGRINSSLRVGIREPEVAQLDRVIESNRLSRDTLVYRGIAGPGNDGVLAGALPGDQVVDRGYSSTSMNPAVSADFGDDLMEIELPAGTPAAPISKVDNREFGHQSEVLVGRGAVYEIMSIEPMTDTGWRSIFGDERRLIQARLVGYVED